MTPNLENQLLRKFHQGFSFPDHRSDVRSRRSGAVGRGLGFTPVRVLVLGGHCPKKHRECNVNPPSSSASKVQLGTVLEPSRANEREGDCIYFYTPTHDHLTLISLVTI